MDTTRQTLLRAVRDSQNREAWGSFYRIYVPMLGHFFRRLGLSDTDTEDVTQDVLMIAHRALRDGVYDPAKGRFRKWLGGVARRQALAALRARRRRTRVQAFAPESGVDLLDQLEDPRNGHARDELWNQEWRYAVLSEALRHARSSVGDKPFRAFRLFAIDRMPVQQVANELGIAPSSVYVYKSRMLEAVRSWVDRFEEC